MGVVKSKGGKVEGKVKVNIFAMFPWEEVENAKARHSRANGPQASECWVGVGRGGGQG